MTIFHSLLVYTGVGLFLIGVPSLKCMPLPDYKLLDVYAVKSCPKNETEWKNASRKLNCSENSTSGYYHCLPSYDLSRLLEFCYDTPGYVEAGICMVLSKSSLLDGKDCSMFTNGCPEKHYRHEMTYQFPACLEIIGSSGCYAADPACRTTTQSPKTTSTSEETSTDESEGTIQSTYTTSTSGGTSTNRKEDTSIYSSTQYAYRIQMGVAIAVGILIPIFILGVLYLVYKKSHDWASRHKGLVNLEIDGQILNGNGNLSDQMDALISREANIQQIPNPERRQPLEERLESIPEASTKAYLERHEVDPTYVRTSAVEVALECLRKEHIIILTGKEGAGKTKLAFQVMHCLSEEGFKALKLENKEEWRKNVNIRLPYVVLLDDVISLAKLSLFFDEEIKEHVSKSFLDEILCGAELGKIYVIIVCRRKELEELKALLPAHELFSTERQNCIVDISSSYTLTEDEKRRMIIQHAQKNKRTLNDENIQEILSIDTFFGFPYTCFLFFAQEDFLQLGPDFFRRTNEILFKRIDSLRKISAGLESTISYSILCYIFEKGVLDVSDYTCLSELSKEISDSLGKANINSSHLEDVVQRMKGTYLVEIKDKSKKYDFSHEAVRETVCISFGSHAPERVIKKCPWKTLNTVVKIASYQQKPQELVLKVSKQYYELLAKRLLVVELDEETIAKNIILSDASSDSEFVRILLKCAVPHMPTILRELWNLTITDKNTTLLKSILEIYGPHIAIFYQQSDCSINFRIDRPDIDSLIKKCIILRKEDKLLTIIRYVKKHQNLQEIASSMYTLKGQEPMSLLQICEKNEWVDVIRELQAI